MRHGHSVAGGLLGLAMLIAVSTVHAILPATADGLPLPSLAPMLERTMPAVVNISTRTRVKHHRSPLLDHPFFRHFFEQPRRRESSREQSLGSGVVVDASRGYVLTNHHVIDKADAITVVLHDGRRLQAKLIGADPDTDIAVIQIPAEDLTALRLADSDRLRVGDFVVAIGNPFGLGQTVTSGIISALGRSGLGIEGYEDFIQTDASINPGNSGGALVDLRGELAGINTAIIAPGGGNVGIGFAIPANMAGQVMDHLIEFGEVRRGLLGVTTQDLTQALAGAFGLEDIQGAVVVEVEGSSPAERAGLEPGDIVLRFNGREVRNSSDLRNQVGLARVGQRVHLDILRGGRPKALRMQVEEPLHAEIQGSMLHKRLSGARFREIQVNTGNGEETVVEVAGVKHKSPAWKAGLREGDRISGVNRLRVREIDEFHRQVLSNAGDLTLHIQRGNSKVYILIR